MATTTMAKLFVFDFTANDVSTIWFDTFTEALKYIEEKRNDKQLHFSPITITEAAR